MGLPDYKDIANLIKTGLTIEAQEKIMELRQGALALQEENLKLRERISSLEAAAALARELVFEAPPGIYWRNRESSREGPFCPVCYDKDQKLMRLHDGRDRGVQSRWLCFACGNAW
ncbi:MAG TPA: hypothetical protein VJA21_23095 [Verrucomicrobiae bacterium]